jgi:hypothetical protein
MKQKSIILSVIILMLLVPGATPVSYEGAAAVSASFPDAGLYVATNSFPRNTMVELTNLGTGQTVRAIVSSGLESPGLLAEISREAADAVGLPARTYGRIRLRAVSDPLAAPAQNPDSRRSGDPDYDPRAAVAQYGAPTPAPNYGYTPPPNYGYTPQAAPSSDALLAIERQIDALRKEVEAERRDAEAARKEMRMYFSGSGRQGGYEQPRSDNRYDDYPRNPSPREEPRNPPPREEPRYAPPPGQNEDIARIREEAQNARKIAEEAKKDAEKANKAAEDAMKKAEDTKSSLTEKEIANYNDQIAQLRKELNDAKEETRNANLQLSLIKAEAEDSAKKSAKELEDIKNQITQLNNEAEDAKKKAEEANAEIQRLKEEAAAGKASADAAKEAARLTEEAKKSAEEVLVDSEKVAETAAESLEPKEYAKIQKELEEIRKLAQRALDIAEETKQQIDTAIADGKIPQGSYDYRMKQDYDRPPVYDYDNRNPQFFSVPTVPRLTKGKYYIQVAAFDAYKEKIPNVEQELSNLKYAYPSLTVLYEYGQSHYRILVGPVNQGEAGMLLKRLQSSGYKQAFLAPKHYY